MDRGDRNDVRGGAHLGPDRLVVPLSYFLDHSFQNWARTSADLLGHCYIYLHGSRRALARGTAQDLRIHTAMEQRVCMLQVSDAFQGTLQLRALMDVRNSGDA